MEKTTVQINGVGREVSFGMFAYGIMVKAISEHVQEFQETEIDPITLSGIMVYSGLAGACKVNREKPDFDLSSVNSWLDQNLIAQIEFDKINKAYSGSIAEQKMNDTLDKLTATKDNRAADELKEG